MSYKLLMWFFGFLTLGLIAFLGNSFLLAHRRYFIEFKTKRHKRKRGATPAEQEEAARPFFLFWWLRQYAASLAAVCFVYLLAAAGTYLVAPLLSGAKKNRYTGGIPAKPQQQKELWKSYVELSVAAEKNPENAGIHLQLARAQRKQGLEQKALASYHKVIYLDPLSLDAQFELGCMAAAAGDATLAASQVSELSRRWPNRPERYLLQSRIAFLAGKQPEALAYLRSALAVKPGSREIRVLLVDMLLQQHAYAEAIRLAQEGLKLPPDQRNETVNATQELRTSGVHPFPSSSTSLSLLLARSLLAVGRHAEAEATLQAATKADPFSPLPALFLGDVRIARGEYGGALLAYEETLKRDPENYVVINNIASLAVEHGFDLERAATLAARMYAKYPQDPAVADTLGWVLCQQGKVAAALPLLQFAATGASNNPVHRYHYGAALLKNGQNEAARKELGAALKLSRQFDGVEKAQALLASAAVK